MVGLLTLPARVEDWHEDAREAYEERAAILEFDALMPRREAERQAKRMVRARFLAKHPAPPSRTENLLLPSQSEG
jgi:hypothetical protein